MLNAAKTQVLRVENSQCGDNKLDGLSLLNQRSFLYLGVHIDEKLTFVDHIQEAVRKMARHVPIVAQLRTMVGSFFLLCYPNVYVQPVNNMAFCYMDVLQKHT